MWKIILTAINFFSGATFGKIVDATSTVLVNNSNNAAQTRRVEVGAGRDVAIETIHANAGAFREQMSLAALRWGWWGTRYLLLAAALPPIIHSGAIYLDSTPFPYLMWGEAWLPAVATHVQGSWEVARAPGVYEGQELQIIAAVVGYQLAQTGVGGFVSWLNKK
jgi:hypothetical protein